MVISESVRSTRKRVASSTLILLGLLVLVALGFGIAYAPKVALALIALLLVIPLIESALARIAFVALGGVVVLGVSDTLSVDKIIYLCGCGLAVGVELLRLPSLSGTKTYTEMRTVLRVSFVFAVYVIVETAAAVVGGVAPADAVRESASYLLFASIPLLALDASISVKREMSGALFLVATLLGTASYVVLWLSNRGLATTSVSRIALSGALPAALLCYLSAGIVLGRNRVLWAIAAGVVLGLVLFPGNRSSFLLLVGPLTIALAGRAGRWRRIVGLVVMGSVVALLAIATACYAARLLSVDTSVIASRYQSLIHPSGLGSDQSLQVRLTESRVGWSVFRSHLLFGSGPGYVFAWTNPFTGLQTRDPYIDSPLQFAAKFGLVGMLVWFGAMLAYGSLLVRLNRSPSVPRSAALGFGAILAAWSILGPPMVDKGALLGLMLLLVLGLPDRGAAVDRSPTLVPAVQS
jgi:hypothetical protein